MFFWKITASTGVSSQSNIEDKAFSEAAVQRCSWKNEFNFIEIAIRHGCSLIKLLHIFRTPFPRNTSGWLLLLFAKIVISLDGGLNF